MNTFLTTLQTRNKALYYFGWVNLIGAVLCIVPFLFTNTQVLGVHAWIKPFKFLLSTVIFSWSMGWYMFYLKEQKVVRAFNLVVILSLSFELIYIIWQAANGELSHFNIATAFHGTMFSLMGLVISLMTIWTGYIAFLFWKNTFPQLPVAYVEGIRTGIVLFVLFAFAGGLMAARLSHTVGAAMDTVKGLPIVNWSRESGDLRIAHFFGMHALQVLPLLGYYVFKTKRQIIVAAVLYAVLATALLIQALKAVPLIGL
jgi:hypothetical protein